MTVEGVKGEVLVVIMNSSADWAIVQTQHWYRIPLAQAERLQQRYHWPPQWLAFYQTRVFGPEAHAIHYWARVDRVSTVARWELFPDQPRDARSEQRYCKLNLSQLEKLSQAIVSQRLRRITFVPTTRARFQHATEINELL